MTRNLYADCGTYRLPAKERRTGRNAQRRPFFACAALLVLLPAGMLAAVTAAVTALLLPVALLLGWPL